MKQVEKRAIELFSYISGVNNINSGGCLFAAFAVYNVLKKEGLNSSDVVIVQLHSDSDLINWNQDFINGYGTKAYSSNHFVLSVDNGKTFIGTEGIYRRREVLDKYDFIIPNHKIDKFCENALVNGSWNKRFKRTKGVREINFMLGTNIPNFRKNYKLKLV